MIVMLRTHDTADADVDDRFEEGGGEDNEGDEDGDADEDADAGRDEDG